MGYPYDPFDWPFDTATPEGSGAPPFIEGKTLYGRVVDIQQGRTFPTDTAKVWNVLSGEPIQLSHEWVTTTVYLRPVDSFDPDMERAVIVYGSLQGAVRPGNIVQVRVAKRRGRLIVKRMVNVTTQMPVEMEGTMKIWHGFASLLALSLLVFVILSSLINALFTGSLLRGLLETLMLLVDTARIAVLLVLMALGPIVPIVVGLLILIAVVKHLIRS